MTTRFYVDISACVKKITSTHGSMKPRCEELMHGPTELWVGSDFQGFYMHSHDDPYADKGFKPRKELIGNDISFFSCNLAVREEVYLGEIPDGAYTNGDEGTAIVVGECETESYTSKTMVRRIKITTPTWENMERAIEHIRRGEITPVGGEQTVLEMREIQLAQAEGTNTLLSAQMIGLSSELSRLQTFAKNASLWIGNKSVFEMTLKQLSSPAILEAVLTEMERMYKDQREFTSIKATRWYRTLALFQQTQMPWLQWRARAIAWFHQAHMRAKGWCKKQFIR